MVACRGPPRHEVNGYPSKVTLSGEPARAVLAEQVGIWIRTSHAQARALGQATRLGNNQRARQSARCSHALSPSAAKAT